MTQSHKATNRKFGLEPEFAHCPQQTQLDGTKMGHKVETNPVYLPMDISTEANLLLRDVWPQ